jgi:isoleucyl-tRNA synthetase
MKYGLPIINPVDAAGRFTNEAGPYAGQNIWKANQAIVEDLRASGALWRAEEYQHSYPHCWRCHNPVIFRATAQWFIAMDQNRLRAKAIDATDGVAFTPEWGKNRLQQMLENHPEWCISRQRTWGTPIPALVCKECGESFLDPAVARKTAARFAEVGADSWWSEPIDSFLPAGTKCPKCGGTSFEREKNIVDIWFESGVTHFAVLGKDGLPWPSDVVLEGGDQYRGWFRSSLLTAVAVKGRAPYRRVVKNGWVNDEQGRPMSKSRGTGFDAKEAMGKWGADVLRLWAGSVEFIDDVRFGPHVIAQVGNVYRNIRNRIRFMLGNLFDLHLTDLVPRERMHPLDRLACSVVDALVIDVKALFDRFEIHDAYLRIVAFESAMSGFYFEALKDPLYSLGAGDERRRSAQSALLYALQRFLTVVSPVLSFTAEEAWQALPNDLRGDARSIFDTSFDIGSALGQRPEEARLWDLLRKLRARVAASTAPRDFEIRLKLEVTPAVHRTLVPLGDNLREALVVSQLELSAKDAPSDSDGVVAFEIEPADGHKCRRCWKFRELGTDPAHPHICAECAAVVKAL